MSNLEKASVILEFVLSPEFKQWTEGFGLGEDLIRAICDNQELTPEEYDILRELERKIH